MGSGAIAVDVINQLLPFADKNKIIEVAIRGQNSKFKEFVKVALNVAGENQGKGAGQIVNVGNILANSNPLGAAIGVANLGTSGANTAIGLKALNMLKTLTGMQGAGLVLNGLNLCATCVGFAIINSKLESMNGRICELWQDFKTTNGIQANFEFDKVLSEHSNMLDSRRRKCYYTEEQMRTLVSDEYNVLGYLIDIFLNDVSNGGETLITSIFSLASMLAVSLQYFDEIYYYNNKENITDGEAWHSDHNKWVSVFDRIVSPEFIKKIQDYGIFELGLNTIQNDYYYHSLYDQVVELKECIIDNQILIKSFDNSENLSNFKNTNDKVIREEIIDAMEKGNLNFSEEERNEIFRQLAIA